MTLPVTQIPLGNNKRLRPICREDLRTTLAWRNQPDVRRWFKHSEPLTWEQHITWFERYLKKDDDLTLVIEDAETKEILGQAAIYSIDKGSREAEIGRFISAPQQRGKGYIQAACKALLRLAFDELQLDRVYLEVFKANRAAIHVYRKCGFCFEGEDGDLARMSIRRPSPPSGPHAKR
jgi:RimJ/RimL family protein N-acetyltransferase